MSFDALFVELVNKYKLKILIVEQMHSLNYHSQLSIGEKESNHYYLSRLKSVTEAKWK